MERGWGRSQAGEFLLQLSLALKDFKDLFPLKKKKAPFHRLLRWFTISRFNLLVLFSAARLETSGEDSFRRNELTWVLALMGTAWTS